MAQNGDTGGSNEPENGAEWGSPEAERNADDQKGRVELGSGRAPAAKLQVVALELANPVHAANEQQDDEEQGQVGDQAVDDEHGENGCIVAREVAEVVVDAALHLAEVGWLGDALHVEELGDGAQVREPAGERLRLQAVEATGEVQPGRQRVNGDAESRHEVRLVCGLRRGLRRGVGLDQVLLGFVVCVGSHGQWCAVEGGCGTVRRGGVETVEGWRRVFSARSKTRTLSSAGALPVSQEARESGGVTRRTVSVRTYEGGCEGEGNSTRVLAEAAVDIR